LVALTGTIDFKLVWPWDGRGVVEVDLNLAIGDDDALGDRFDDAALLLFREFGPVRVQVPRRTHDLTL